MKKLITVILAVMSMNVQWLIKSYSLSMMERIHGLTLIINVTNAKLFIEPGVAFVSATDGYRNIASPSIFGVKGVDAITGNGALERLAIVTGGWMYTDKDTGVKTGGTKTFDFVQTGVGSNDYNVVQYKSN